MESHLPLKIIWKSHIGDQILLSGSPTQPLFPSLLEQMMFIWKASEESWSNKQENMNLETLKLDLVMTDGLLRSSWWLQWNRGDNVLSGLGSCSWVLMPGYEGSQAWAYDLEGSVYHVCTCAQTHIHTHVHTLNTQSLCPSDWLMTHTINLHSLDCDQCCLGPREILPSISDLCPWNRRWPCLTVLKAFSLCLWKWQSQTCLGESWEDLSGRSA